MILWILLDFGHFNNFDKSLNESCNYRFKYKIDGRMITRNLNMIKHDY